MTAPIL